MVTICFAFRENGDDIKGAVDFRRTPDITPLEKKYGEAIYAALESALITIRRLDGNKDVIHKDEIALQAALDTAKAYYHPPES